MKKYIRFISGLNTFLKGRLSAPEAYQGAQNLLKDRIAKRDENFLNIVDKGIFSYSKSPYKMLLEPKKIAYRDIKNKVESEGIENTLEWLKSEEVYFTVDEFKGKVPVKRNGVEFVCKESMFDNPFLSTAYEVRSGATRSAGTRVRIDFDYLSQRSLYDAYLLHLHGSLTVPIANWFPLFPGAPGINSSLRFSRIGNPPQKWFSQVEKAQIKVNWEKTWGTELIFFMSRLHGMSLAKPEYVSLNHAHKIARWASAMLDHYPNCVIYTFATSAVRVCMAAKENGYNIKGTRFLVTGETLTGQKRKEIESVGAVAIPVYGISEAGVIAAGCEKHNNCSSSHGGSDHCHLYKDTTAVITHKQRVPHFDLIVDSFLFSSLLYESPKLLLNVGMGDYGSVYTKATNCGFGKIGFDTHITNIKSYEKLTGEGVTFVDTDFIRIIEKDLPSKFGGSSTDYQLVEEEDEKGFNRLRLFVSPTLGTIREDELVTFFMNSLKQSESSPESWAQSGSEMWNQARTIRIKREHPATTPSGKILPFHIQSNAPANLKRITKGE
ncbi:hypothetical protein QA601_13355 [Chitinispirillales bacterium ANBcel5]|uniref:hypothetical protein n=1 Tax=Cellulosispirillum alkaliphilum TaxID=3039283 RepID=UPI002A57B0F9|nr:hypothetical protein [Chitinispirillales bacterium ANBcel5]